MLLFFLFPPEQRDRLGDHRMISCVFFHMGGSEDSLERQTEDRQLATVRYSFDKRRRGGGGREEEGGRNIG